MIFGAECGFQEAFDDLAVSEALLLGALALRDRRGVGECRAQHGDFTERDGAEGRRERPWKRESAGRAHLDNAAAIGARVQGLKTSITRLRASPHRVPGWRLVLDDDRGADGYAAVEIGHILIGHAEAAGGNCLSN